MSIQNPETAAQRDYTLRLVMGSLFEVRRQIGFETEAWRVLTLGAEERRLGERARALKAMEFAS